MSPKCGHFSCRLTVGYEKGCRLSKNPCHRKGEHRTVQRRSSLDTRSPPDRFLDPLLQFVCHARTDHLPAIGELDKFLHASAGQNIHPNNDQTGDSLSLKLLVAVAVHRVG
jgi:hypothetical protein